MARGLRRAKLGANTATLAAPSARKRKGPLPPALQFAEGRGGEGGKGAYTIQCPSLRVELRNARPCLLGGVVRKEPGLVG